ncbi:kidins220b, partial [Symbiodinium microadriaticum]
EICKPRPTARVLKQHLQSHCGEPPFRQRLLGPEGRLIHDDEIFVASVELHLVLLRLLPASDIEATLALAGRDCAEEVKALLDRPQDPNAADDAGDTALHAAALFGAERCLKLLLEAGADKDRANSHGETPVLVAAQSGWLGSTRLLLEASCAVGARRSDGATPLLLAAQQGHTEVVDALLQSRAETGSANRRGETALLLAAQRGHKDAVRALLGAGADDLPRKDGATALSLATQRDHLHVALLLLEASADKDKALKDCTAASRNDWLAIPAIHFGRWHFNVFEILLLKHTAQGIGFRV